MAARMRPLRASHLWLVAILVAWVPAYHSSAVEIRYTAVARSGQPIPEAPHLTFGRFGTNARVDINNAGQILLEGDGDFPGLWLASGDSLLPVASPAVEAPGMPGRTFAGNPGAMPTAQLNDVGQVIFITNASDLTRGVWAGSAGNLRLVASEQMQAPGLPAGTTFAPLANLAGINNAGHVYVTRGEPGFLTASDDGIWVDHGSGLTPLVLGQLPLPGGTAPLLDFYGPVMNQRGDVAFHGIISVSMEPQDRGVWFGTPQDLRLVARTGMPAPGTNGEHYHTVHEPTLDDAGRLAFTADLPGAGRRQGLWIGDPSAPKLLVSTDMTIPGRNERYEDLFAPTLHRDGRLAFHTRIGGPTPGQSSPPGAIVAGTPDALAVIVADGDQAPGLPPGFVFQDVGRGGMKFDDFGHLVMRLVVAASGYGIWASDAEGNLTAVARPNDLIELSPGEFRRIVSIGNRWDVNDRGQVVFTARFTDSSTAIVMATIVPEPLMVPPAALACVACARHRRHRRRR